MRLPRSWSISRGVGLHSAWERSLPSLPLLLRFLSGHVCVAILGVGGRLGGVSLGVCCRWERIKRSLKRRERELEIT